MRVLEVVVVFDAGCPRCSRIARELPGCLTVPVRARSCAERRLDEIYPNLRDAVGSCARPAVGILRTDGQVRWWVGRTGAVGSSRCSGRTASRRPCACSATPPAVDDPAP